MPVGLEQNLERAAFTLDVNRAISSQKATESSEAALLRPKPEGLIRDVLKSSHDESRHFSHHLSLLFSSQYSTFCNSTSGRERQNIIQYVLLRSHLLSTCRPRICFTSISSQPPENWAIVSPQAGGHLSLQASLCTNAIECAASL